MPRNANIPLNLSDHERKTWQFVSSTFWSIQWIMLAGKFYVYSYYWSRQQPRKVVRVNAKVDIFGMNSFCRQSVVWWMLINLISLDAGSLGLCIALKYWITKFTWTWWPDAIKRFAIREAGSFASVTSQRIAFSVLANISVRAVALVESSSNPFRSVNVTTVAD